MQLEIAVMHHPASANLQSYFGWYKNTNTPANVGIKSSS